MLLTGIPTMLQQFRLPIALIWLAGTTLAAAGEVPLPQPRPPLLTAPMSFREAAGSDFSSADATAEPSACRLRLDKIAAAEPMPRLIGPGACGGRDMVRLNAVTLADHARIEIKPAPLLRCEMAEQLAIWIREDAAPRVSDIGAALQSIENYDDFDCRGRNRVAGAKISEHGKGNAIDIRSLTFSDGRRIGLTDIAAPKDLRLALRASACARFTTVLGPGSDGYHEQHIHFDLAARHNGYRICEWDVSGPRPPTELASAQIDGKAVPLPVPRPAVAGVRAQNP
jgi:hypothetical protein